MSKTIAAVFFFRSESNPDKEYQTLKMTDGTCTCQCRGWTQRITADGSRSCRHTRDVDAGIAERTAVRFVDYSQGSRPTTETAPAPKPKRKKASTPEILVERRNFQFS